MNISAELDRAVVAHEKAWEVFMGKRGINPPPSYPVEQKLMAGMSEALTAIAMMRDESRFYELNQVIDWVIAFRVRCQNEACETLGSDEIRAYAETVIEVFHGDPGSAASALEVSGGAMTAEELAELECSDDPAAGCKRCGGALEMDDAAGFFCPTCDGFFCPVGDPESGP